MVRQKSFAVAHATPFRHAVPDGTLKSAHGLNGVSRALVSKRYARAVVGIGGGAAWLDVRWFRDGHRAPAGADGACGVARPGRRCPRGQGRTRRRVASGSPAARRSRGGGVEWPPQCRFLTGGGGGR